MSVNKKSCRGCNTKKFKKKEMQNMLGHNFRMGDECAIAFNQIKKLKKFVNKNKLALDLLKELKV